MIVGSSVGLAMLVTAQPDVATAVPGWAQIVFGSGITLGSITAIVLNVGVPPHRRGRGPAVAGAPGAGTVRLDQVNRMSRDEFVATFGRLFQGSATVGTPSWARLRPAAVRRHHEPARRVPGGPVLRAAAEQRELMAAYPDLGADRVADGDEGEDSARDQASAGLTRLADEDREEFAELAAAYRERFGFPLIVCVRDSGPASGCWPRGSSGWRTPRPGARRRAHRDREGGQPPLRRPRRHANPIATARTRAFGR